MVCTSGGGVHAENTDTENVLVARCGEPSARVNGGVRAPQRADDRAAERVYGSVDGRAPRA
jgi:hypothetical protein